MVTEGDKVMLPANLGLIGASRMAPQQTQHQQLLLHSIQEDGSSQVLTHSPFPFFSRDRPIVQGYPMVASIDLQVLLRPRPYPVRGHRLLQFTHSPSQHNLPRAVDSLPASLAAKQFQLSLSKGSTPCIRLYRSRHILLAILAFCWQGNQTFPKVKQASSITACLHSR